MLLLTENRFLAQNASVSMFDPKYTLLKLIRIYIHSNKRYIIIMYIVSLFIVYLFIIYNYITPVIVNVTTLEVVNK